MTIIEALKKSDKVRRECWDYGYFITWKRAKWISNEDFEHHLEPDFSGLLAIDWQPYEPEKVKCEACKEAEEFSTPYLMEKHLRQFHCQCKEDK